MPKEFIGYTTGVFDLFHIGHVNILRRAKLKCDYLIVGVMTDDLCEEKKGRRPIVSFAERVEIVGSLRFVDEAVPEDELDKMAAWRKLKFHRIFKGDDWKGTPEWNTLEGQFSSVGVEVIYFPYTHHTSSSVLRRVLEQLYEHV
jgi:glycerol-3-phosphate cytidylyltransferase